MTIDINDREMQLLAEMFDVAEKELITGIDHADTREYRQKLKDRLGIVEALHAKLGMTQRSSDLVH
jgi:hypothetical protein